jgi:putative holliday junction resolvase
VSRLGRRAMGLDVGEVRIGVALSDEGGTIATPLAVVRRGPRAVAELRDLAARWEVDALVVGMPTGMSGREGPQAAATRAFAADLEAAIGPRPPLRFWDERLTTAIADRVLAERKADRARRKAERDAIAAAVILQGWLDAGRWG